MRVLTAAFLVTGCAATPAARPAVDAFVDRDGPSTRPLTVPAGPSAYTLTPRIAGPDGAAAPHTGRGGGAISKVCTPQPNGLGADCRAL